MHALLTAHTEHLITNCYGSRNAYNLRRLLHDRPDVEFDTDVGTDTQRSVTVKQAFDEGFDEILVRDGTTGRSVARIVWNPRLELVVVV